MGLAFYTTSNAASGVDNVAERMRIDNTGNLLVGTTSSLEASQTGTVSIVCSSASDKPLFMRNAAASAGLYWKAGPDGSSAFVVYNGSNTGVYIANGATSWTANSDERLKTDLVPIVDASNKVSTLRAVTGRYKTDEAGVSRSFLIAQDIQKVLPEAVNVQADEQGTLGLQYTDVIPLLVAAIQELSAKVAALEAKGGA
mgnify:CR=1 FL=1